VIRQRNACLRELIRTCRRSYDDSDLPADTVNPSQPLLIGTSVRDGVHVIVVRGNLDQMTAHRVGSVVADGSRTLPVIFDVSDVPSVSTVAIRGLVGKQTTPTALVCAPRHVARVLDGLPVIDWIPVCTDIEAAIAMLTIMVLPS
jgi:hypothetical protein